MIYKQHLLLISHSANLSFNRGNMFRYNSCFDLEFLTRTTTYNKDNYTTLHFKTSVETHGKQKYKIITILGVPANHSEP